MSLASWTLLFGPSGADDDACRRGRVSQCCCLVGLGCWRRVRDTRRVRDRLLHGFFFLVHVQHDQVMFTRMRNGERLTVCESVFMLVGEKRRARGGARQFETTPIHRPRRYFAQWRLMFDPVYLLSLSMPGQLCVG